DRFAAEVWVEWHCQEDTEYLGSRQKGQIYPADCAGFFHLKDGKITHVKIYLNEIPQPP
ncbi:unnamed protein product, partial [marine sediment metagenome]